MIHLLPGILTTLVAIASGAGGAALLELYLKPRRKKRAAAKILYAEILQNLQMICLQSEARKKKPLVIPADFRMSTIGWEAVVPIVQELPLEDLQDSILLYSRFGELNRKVDLYAEALDQWETAEPGERKERLEHQLSALVATFNSGLDIAYEHSLEVGRSMASLGKIEEESTGVSRDFAAEFERHAEEQKRGIDAIKKVGGLGRKRSE